MNSEKNIDNILFQTLAHFWHFTDFRESQNEIIKSIISGKDTLVLLPTGGGKSLCYQLPSLVLEGTALVISPLLALMKDQVVQLQNRGIEAAYISSELDEIECEDIYARCREGIVKILYVSPERLTNSHFLRNLEEIDISLIAVDEAHCISEWGQDFRPSYQNIKTFREQFLDTACIALTATATPKVLNEIKEKLGLKNPNVFQKSFSRDNLSIIIEQISDKYQRIHEILSHNNSTGIIYARTRAECVSLCHYLKNQGHRNVDFFHAGLTPAEKNRKQKLWMNSHQHILIATNAFGMGIDKDDVRFVIHLSPPPSVENYYQEIGRAGRDGQPSYAFLFWNHQELRNIDEILDNQIPSRKQFTDIIKYIYSIFQIAENELIEETFQLQLERVKSFTKCSIPKIKNVLNFLHNQEIIYYNDQKSHSIIELNIRPEDIDLLPKKDAYFVELLLRNLPGLSGRRVHFSEVSLAKKMGADIILIKQRIKDLQSSNHIRYIDGAVAGIKFIKHRNDRLTEGKYWKLFEQIQRNKLQKWADFKFYLTEKDFCKMKLILSYFGEKNAKSCGNCYVCKQKKQNLFGSGVEEDIIRILQTKPASIEEIAVSLKFYRKEQILESLILLLDAGKVRMLDFRTYTLS